MEFECDQCGACCKELIVEVYDIDIMREPKLATADIGSWTREMVYAELMAELEQDGKCLLIAGPGKPCKMLDKENHCDIYPTRPNVCVAMRAGDEECQLARANNGLAPLLPKSEESSNQ
ncbi:YkgJ family cysteine cluster protein [Novipirellula sp. SH528]|uniref:YkgJ family cysteine cluster protein n=1 Tax=Novipirellula sp. SH528 TaxID=3454466 RepID=UPI003FA18CD5